MVLTLPSAYAKKTSSTTPMKRPVSTIPGVSARLAWMAFQSSFFCLGNTQSIMYEPLSVITGPAFFIAIRRPAVPPKRRGISRHTGVEAKGRTSMGRYWYRSPRETASFVWSAITRNFLDACWTIFSLARQPPPPLMHVRSASTSSAPSMHTSSVGVASRSETGRPESISHFFVMNDVGTQIRSRSEPACTACSRYSTRYLTVDPDPTPSLHPG
ncbi:hypothetical protein PENTCL1PPCAC_10634 [Pristionchus entomophagus]|uniref:G protein-coupled receptor n=1 Tax=Pristionchus entomophagus TaxID=358040 RepID=A0AAV5SZV5_9BILA|nr:hypothetical protein PENTCL1PPCAC_10634 [Pristionchus entomophagus]